jgi:hypothetical protein
LTVGETAASVFRAEKLRGMSFSHFETDQHGGAHRVAPSRVERDAALSESRRDAVGAWGDERRDAPSLFE